MKHPRIELKNYCGPRQEGDVIHGWTLTKLETGTITDEAAVIVGENVFRSLLISLNTLKRKSEIRVDYQRRRTQAGGSSVPLLEQIGPPLDEGGMWQSMAHSNDARMPTGKLVHLDPNGLTRGELSFAAESAVKKRISRSTKRPIAL